MKAYNKTLENRKIKAVLFDLDGVLVDSFDVWYNIFNDTLVHFGHSPISKKVFAETWGTSTNDDTRKFMPERTVTEVSKYLEKVYDKYAKKYVLVNPNAKLILETLRSKKIKIACVTNSHRIMTRKVLKRIKLIKYFDVVITADDVRNPKPSPDMLLKACKVLNVSPRESVCIGDTDYDMLAGKRAGCINILYKMKRTT